MLRLHGSHAIRSLVIFVTCVLAGVACSGDPDEDSPSGDAIHTIPSETAAPRSGGAEGPQLVPPDLRVMEPAELYIETTASGRRTVRFSTTLLNAGDGPLELVGTPDPDGVSVEASQRILREDNSFAERVAGRFRLDLAHAHWHFVDLTVFELWTHDDDGKLEELVATTGKATFCAVDEVPALAGAQPPAYFGCSTGVQGLSAGWSDTYKAALPGQELDITDVADGRYVIQTIVDPDNLLLEAADNNNAARIYIEIRGDDVETHDAP